MAFKILVVDDEIDLRDLMARRFRREMRHGEFELEFAADGVEALSQRDEPFGPPREQTIGVLFADLRGFTAMCERMQPADVLLFLRRFHSRMEDLVFAHDGTLDDYVGDGVFATFGVPDAGPNDASNTLACARQMLSMVEGWNEERAERGEDAIRIVNVASRLERLTRELDCDLEVSDDLIKQVEVETGCEGRAGIELEPPATMPCGVATAR